MGLLSDTINKSRNQTSQTPLDLSALKLSGSPMVDFGAPKVVATSPGIEQTYGKPGIGQNVFKGFASSLLMRAGSGITEAIKAGSFKPIVAAGKDIFKSAIPKVGKTKEEQIALGAKQGELAGLGAIGESGAIETKLTPEIKMTPEAKDLLQRALKLHPEVNPAEVTTYAENAAKLEGLPAADVEHIAESLSQHTPLPGEAAPVRTGPFLDRYNQVMQPELTAAEKEITSLTQEAKGLTSKIKNLKAIVDANPFDETIANELQKTQEQLKTTTAKLNESVIARNALPEKPAQPLVPAETAAKSVSLPVVEPKLKPGEVPPLLGDKPLFEGLSAPAPATKVPEQMPEVKVSPKSEGVLSSGIVYNNLGKDASLVKEADQTLAPFKIEPKNYNLYNRFKNFVAQKWTNIREFVQDDWIRVKRLMENPDLKVTEQSNPYNKEILYRGKIDTRIELGREFADSIDKEVIAASDKLGIDSKQFYDDLNKYLQAKHASERNAKLGEGAAGMTTAEAEKIVKDTPADSEVVRIADRLIEFNKKSLDILHEGEIITDQLYNTLKTTYKNHVPLNRIFPETENIDQALSGRGFDVKGTGLYRAKGSEREVSDITGNIIANYEQAIFRSEKNIVDLATFKFIQDNKQALGDLFEQYYPKAIGRTFGKEGEQGSLIMQKITDPTVLSMRKAGEPVYIKINDPKLAVALRGVNRMKLDAFTRFFGSISRFYSGLATRFNPEFAFPNKIRDLQEAMVYLASKKEMGLSGATKMLSEEVKSYSALYDYLRGNDTEGARLYQQMKMDGGTTGGMGLSTKSQITLDLEKMKELNRSKPKQAAQFVLDKVDQWNTFFEDTTRLSTYRAALDRGLSRERAAVLAKESTINFNKFGTGGPIINALYMFSNASIQGSAKMLMAMKDPKVAISVITALGTAVASVRTWNDHIDPEWRDKVSKWDALNSLIVVLPSKEGQGINYISIPVSWGLKPIKVAEDYAYDLATNSKTNLADSANSIMSALIEGYNPVGGTDLLSAITPTVLDLPVEIGRNKAWTGNLIKPDWDRYAPESIKYFGNLKDSVAGNIFIGLTDKLSQMSSGRIEISPADINYAYEQLIGGTGRTLSKTINTIKDIGQAKVPPSADIPFISRFLRNVSQEQIGAGSLQAGDVRGILANQSRDRFNLTQMAESTYQDMKKLPREEASAQFQQVMKDNPALAQKISDIAKQEKLGLTYTDRLVAQLGVTDGTRAKYIYSQLMKLKTNEEKGALWTDLVKKKIISDQVATQIKYLIKQSK